jgi:hypothetical protein
VSGSALLIALATIAILSLMAASVCRITTQRQRGCFQEASWGEALAAAEAGADIAIATLRAGKWTDWQGPDANGVRTYQTPVLTHDGEGSTSFYATIQVDSPSSFTTANGAFYRIRSTGTALLSGGNGTTTQDKLNNRLWRLSLKRSRDSGAPINGAGMVSRTIEVIARPGIPFPRAITLTNSISGTSGAYIDSFDSEDITKSSNSLYDAAKRQENARLASLDSTGSDLKGLQLYGDLLYTGPTVKGTQGVTGDIKTPFYETLLPVAQPAWTSVTGSFGAAGGTITLPSGPVGSPTRYKMSSIAFGSSSDILTLAPPAPGLPGEVEIWVTGDVKISGSAQIISKPGVKVTFYIEGNVTSTGTAMVNQSNTAANLVIKGVTPTDGSARSYKLSGTADFTASLYAPSYDITLGGGGSYTGAFVGKTMTMSGGSAAIHYDEALGRFGGGNQYTVASWIEDLR